MKACFSEVILEVDVNKSVDVKLKNALYDFFLKDELDKKLALNRIEEGLIKRLYENLP
jgi:hypothetical protein